MSGWDLTCAGVYQRFCRCACLLTLRRVVSTLADKSKFQSASRRRAWAQYQRAEGFAKASINTLTMCSAGATTLHLLLQHGSERQKASSRSEAMASSNLRIYIYTHPFTIPGFVYLGLGFRGLV